MRRPVPILLMSRDLGGGGTQRQMTEVAKALDRTRFSPHVGCFFAEGLRHQELLDAGVPLHEFRVRSLVSPRVLRFAAELGDYVRRKEIQLVHTFDVPATLFGVFASRFYRVPVVLSSQRAFRSLTPEFGRHLLRVTDLLVDTVVVNSGLLRTQMMEEDRIPPSRLKLCYNGLDLDTLQREGASKRPELGEARLVVGSTSMLRPEKGVMTLIDAFARLLKRVPDVKLLIVGDGPCRAELEARAQSHGIAGACHFAGETTQVAPWLRAIDIFVLPSLSEALSNSLMEAMAIGCAPVASRVGGNPELVEDGANGFLFPPGDAVELATRLEQLASSESLRHNFSRASRERMRAQFSLAASIRCFEELYTSLLTSKGLA